MLLFLMGYAVVGSSPAHGAPCKSTIVGHVDTVSLKSRTYHNERMLRVWTPPGYDNPANAALKYKVIYLLDGQDAFDVCTAEDHLEMRADETLTALITAGQMEPIIAVGVDGGSPIDVNGQTTDGGAQRAREYLPYPDPNIPTVRDVEGSRFGGFMEDEVMPLVAAHYRILQGPRNTAIWGASYAGVAALYALIQRPDLFGSGDIESPAIQVGNGQMIRDTQSLVEGPTRVAFGVGTAELDAKFPGAEAINHAIVLQVTLLANHLREVAIAPPRVLLTVREGARHNATSFGDRFEVALLFLYAPGK
jgi:predicted alpha/beta superfamily hydrolase